MDKVYLRGRFAARTGVTLTRLAFIVMLVGGSPYILAGVTLAYGVAYALYAAILICVALITLGLLFFSEGFRNMLGGAGSVESLSSALASMQGFVPYMPIFFVIAIVLAAMGSALASAYPEHKKCRRAFVRGIVVACIAAVLCVISLVSPLDLAGMSLVSGG